MQLTNLNRTIIIIIALILISGLIFQSNNLSKAINEINNAKYEIDEAKTDINKTLTNLYTLEKSFDDFKNNSEELKLQTESLRTLRDRIYSDLEFSRRKIETSNKELISIWRGKNQDTIKIKH